MKLQPFEKTSALWARLHAHYSEQLDLLRRQNDGNLGAEQTQRLRGRIAQVKEFLALAGEPDMGGATDEAAPSITEKTSLGF